MNYEFFEDFQELVQGFGSQNSEIRFRKWPNLSENRTNQVITSRKDFSIQIFRIHDGITILYQCLDL